MFHINLSNLYETFKYTILLSFIQNLCAVDEWFFIRDFCLNLNRTRKIISAIDAEGLEKYSTTRFLENLTAKAVLKFKWITISLSLVSHIHTYNEWNQHGIRSCIFTFTVHRYAMAYMFRRYIACDYKTIQQNSQRVKTKAQSNLSFQQFGICSSVVSFLFYTWYCIATHWLRASLTSLSAFKIIIISYMITFENRVWMIGLL